jgi:hypothetical protein
LQQRTEALVAFTRPARSRPWRRHVLHRFGVVANGLERRDSRRQLEQQRQANTTSVFEDFLQEVVTRPGVKKAISYVQPSSFDMLAGASPASARDGWAE